MHVMTPSFSSRVRADFPVLDQDVNGAPLVYLDNAATSQKPLAVTQAIDAYYKWDNANIHRGVHALAQRATEAYEAARKQLAQFIGAASEREVLFTAGTTASINLVAQSWGRDHLKSGDVVLISRMDHHSNIVPWQMIAETVGAKVEVIEISSSGEMNLEALRRQLETLPVKLVAFPHVSNALGTINPAKEIIAMAHQTGALVMVDGAQAVPHMQVRVQELDADFYAFSGHKMYGPTGIGVLYGKEALLESMPPWQGGGEMIQSVSFQGTTYNTLPHKFEAGTPNIAGGIALGAAVSFMEKVGIEAIGLWEEELLHYATDQLSALEGLKIYGTAPRKAGVISFLVEGVHPYDLGTLLDQQGVAVRTGHHCTEPLMDWYGIPGTVRASFAAYNTIDDIDRLMAAMNKALRMLR